MNVLIRQCVFCVRFRTTLVLNLWFGTSTASRSDPLMTVGDHHPTCCVTHKLVVRRYPTNKPPENTCRKRNAGNLKGRNWSIIIFGNSTRSHNKPETCTTCILQPVKEVLIFQPFPNMNPKIAQQSMNIHQMH
jgi:hypothetical protein